MYICLYFFLLNITNVILNMVLQTCGAGLVRVVPHPHPGRVEGGYPTAIKIPTQVT